ncbi:MAG TPA: hypothetical protein VIR54_20230, partial [Vicinamibacterales bacterium]
MESGICDLEEAERAEKNQAQGTRGAEARRGCCALPRFGGTQAAGHAQQQTPLRRSAAHRALRLMFLGVLSCLRAAGISLS